MIQTILKYQDRLLKNQSITYKRYLYEKINFDDKMVAILGARGVGKTVLLLQKLQELKNNNKKAIYISLDYPFLSGMDLIDLVENLVENKYEYLLLDEVHRFNEFGSYLKTIYDIFDIKVLFTSSSATSILNAKSDLSRRVTLYKLQGFSFREFLQIKYEKNLKSYDLQEILDNHIRVVEEINIQNILVDFKEYLEFGYYPFYTQKQSSFYQNLTNTINITIEIDLPSLGLIEQKYTYKLKKLLEVVCESKPFEVNYTKISSMAEISRVKLYDYITYLKDAEMLLLIDEKTKGIKKISKPAKIYLNNTNLLYAYCQNSEIGTIRETFFANQVGTIYKLHIAKQGDFFIDGKHTVEIGGKDKSFRQIADIPDSYVVSDDTKKGFKDKIPLWLFGFLY